MRMVKYKDIHHVFGNEEDDWTFEVQMILEDISHSRGIVYHPAKGEHESDCFEYVCWSLRYNAFIPTTDAYINVNNDDATVFLSAMTIMDNN